jgi:hypothetical protein
MRVTCAGFGFYSPTRSPVQANSGLLYYVQSLIWGQCGPAQQHGDLVAVQDVLRTVADVGQGTSALRPKPTGGHISLPQSGRSSRCVR